MVEPDSRHLLYEVRSREMTVKSFDDFYEYINAVVLQASGVFKQLDLEQEAIEPEVKHPDIGASATSDTLPENGCVHVYGYITEPRIPWFEYCPRCGEKLEEND